MTDKMLLVLDLDETLLHAAPQQLPGGASFQVFHYYVHLRPGLAAFLTTCATHFELAFWSSASDDYVHEIVRRLLPPGIVAAFVWGRSRCTPFLLSRPDEQELFEPDYASSYEYAKRLKKVRRRGFSLQRVLIVDDTPAKVLHNYGNAIYVKPFYGHPNDTELSSLGAYLAELKDVQNVRTIEKRGWQQRHPRLSPPA